MEGTSFYGVVVKPGRKSVWEPNKERSNKLHLSNATLGANARKGERVRLRCRRADEGKTDIYLCSLLGGSAETSSLDVIFDEYVEISVEGETEVHVTGYTVLLDESRDLSEEYSDSDLDVNGVRMIRNNAESDSDDLDDDEYSDSYDDEDDVEDYLNRAAAMVDEDDSSFSGGSDSESTPASQDSSSLEEMPVEQARALAKKREEPDYIIEEITEEGKAGQGGRKGKKGAEEAGKGQKPQKGKGSKRPASEDLASPKKKEKAARKADEKAAPARQEASSSGSKAGESQASAATPDGGKGKKGKAAAKEPAQSGAQVQRFPSGLEIIKTASGKAGGKLAAPGKRVFCHYVGRLKKTGKIFDKTKNKPFSFRLGVGEVIQGWDIGIKGMRVGDKRRITIPPKLGYGDKTTGPIPKNSTLVFDVELVDVR